MTQKQINQLCSLRVQLDAERLRHHEKMVHLNQALDLAVSKRNHINPDKSSASRPRMGFDYCSICFESTL